MTFVGIAAILYNEPKIMEISTEKEKNTYEISFIQVSEDAALFKKLLEKHGGVLLSERPIVKVRLAYAIKKNAQGFFNSVVCAVDSDVVDKLFSELNSEKDILRATIKKVDDIEKKERKESRGVGRRETGRKTVFTKDAKKPFSQVLSNEALEKKIEEILQ